MLLKIFIFLTSICFSLISNGQPTTLSKGKSQQAPLFVLDSINVDIEQIHFDLNKLSDIKVDKNYYDSAKQLSGKVSMTSREPRSYNFLSIQDINSAYLNASQSPTIYMLDDKFLKDITGFKIDSSYILRIEITGAHDMEYLKNTIPNLTILKIITRSKENLDKQKEIRIRGTQTSLKN